MMDNCPYCGTALVNGNCPYQEQSIFRSDGVIGMVKVYANHTNHIWQGQDSDFRALALMRDVGRLAEAVRFNEQRNQEQALLQIGAQIVNWLRQIKPEWTSE